MILIFQNTCCLALSFRLVTIVKNKPRELVCKKLRIKKQVNERKHNFYQVSEKSLYTSSNKGHITRRHLNYILSKIDHELEKQKRKVALLCGNLCSHI